MLAERELHLTHVKEICSGMERRSFILCLQIIMFTRKFLNFRLNKDKIF